MNKVIKNMLSCTMGDNYKLSYNNTCLIQFRCLQNNLKLTKYFSHPKSSITVIVWIHGGYKGSGYDERILAYKGEIIVVTVNYRLQDLINIALSM